MKILTQFRHWCIGCLLFLLMPFGWCDHALVLVYHRFDQHQYPSTNIHMDQFEAHIKELMEQNYQFVKVSQLPSIVEQNQNKKWVAITIDDGFRSIYEKAWPVFKKYNIPFTVYVSTQAIDEKWSDYLSWAQLKEMFESGSLEVGGHSDEHINFADLSSHEITRQLTENKKKLKDQLGEDPVSFSYTYGVASDSLMKQVKSLGYRLAFGQHSGLISNNSPWFYLPRFSMNEQYGSIERFRMILALKPLLIDNELPYEPLHLNVSNPLEIVFNWTNPIQDAQRLTCYRADDGPINMHWVSTNKMTLSVGDVQPGATRINCTYQDETMQWYWYGMQWFTMSAEDPSDKEVLS